MTNLRIDRLGARGDGIADTADGPVYVPYALPGEVVSVRMKTPGRYGRAVKLQEIITPFPGRQEAACHHFGASENACGGCISQHMGVDTYSDWKRNVVIDALAGHGLVPDVEPLLSVPPATRRRVRFAFQSTAAGMILGFRQARSDRIVNISGCPVALGKIVALIPPMRDFMTGRAERGEIAVTQTDVGADVVIVTDRKPDLDTRMDAPEFCAAAGIARLSWMMKGDPEPEQLLMLTPPTIMFGGVPVKLPPDSFLQPTELGEAALRDRILEGIGQAENIADLFAGCGAFSLPMAAAGRSVTAYEGVASQISAIKGACSPLALTAELQDLARQPLREEELIPYDAVVLDPPRVGAAPQIANLASSKVPTIVYVSCNPATFARDARVLVDGEYRLESVQPVDQFLWSPHVELVAIFYRN